jgi:hypothetical protein
MADQADRVDVLRDEIRKIPSMISVHPRSSFYLVIRRHSRRSKSRYGTIDFSSLRRQGRFERASLGLSSEEQGGHAWFDW